MAAAWLWFAVKGGGIEGRLTEWHSVGTALQSTDVRRHSEVLNRAGIGTQRYEGRRQSIAPWRHRRERHSQGKGSYGRELRWQSYVRQGRGAAKLGMAETRSMATALVSNALAPQSNPRQRRLSAHWQRTDGRSIGVAWMSVDKLSIGIVERRSAPA